MAASAWFGPMATGFGAHDTIIANQTALNEDLFNDGLAGGYDMMAVMEAAAMGVDLRDPGTDFRQMTCDMAYVMIGKYT